MNLRIVGASYKNCPVELREKLAFAEGQLPEALQTLSNNFNCEAVILSTCNRVELYLASNENETPKIERVIDHWSRSHQLDSKLLQQHLYDHTAADAVGHLFRVTSSLDSLIVGEGQIAAQVRTAFEMAQKSGQTGPVLNTLFNHAMRAAKRARTETGITLGHVSVSSVAVDFVKQVFDRFDDKNVLIIGAGKMGRLTLKHLQELQPKRIQVTNRSPEKAIELASQCNGSAVPWDNLDAGLNEADIVLSTTGSPELIMTSKRFRKATNRRGHWPIVILDIAVPRDFDPDIHDGERVFLFNIDDLKRIREQTLNKRHRHIVAAEAILEEEKRKFLEDWTRRRNGPIIAQLTQEFDKRRHAIVDPLLQKLSSKLSMEERAYLEGAFRLFQNQLLYMPIDALKQSSREGNHGALLEALRRLFRLGE
jgi:glutamyl-tRNA reductase